MPHIPWRNEARYEQVKNDDGRRQYPYFPNQAVASSRGCPINSTSTLELDVTVPISPLHFRERTPSFLTTDVPLVPPIVQDKPRPCLEKSSSLNWRPRSRSSERAPVRRRRSKDMIFRKTANLQSIEQRGPGETGQATKPRRCKSLEESQELLGFFHNGDPVSKKSCTDSKMHRTRLHDGNHRHHRKMTRLQRSLSPQSDSEKSIHSQRSSDSRSPSAERRRGLRQRSQRSLECRSSEDEKKGDLNSNVRSQRRRHNNRQRSEPNLKSLKIKSTSVEGTDGCCIIRSNYRLKLREMRSKSFEYRNPSKLSARPGLENRSQSHKRLEAKLVKLEEIKKQREPRDDSPGEGLAKFKIKPPSLRKKLEVHDICF